MRKLFTLLFLLFTTTFFYAQTHEGDVVLSTQKEVDNFKGTTIMGDLIIKQRLGTFGKAGFGTASDTITNLNNLSGLKEVQGDVKIIDNAGLINLDGLQGLKTIKRNLIIKNNTNLMDIYVLGHLKYIGKDLLIDNNPALPDIVFREARLHFLICNKIAARLKVRKKPTQEFTIFYPAASTKTCDKDTTPGNPFMNEEGDEDESKFIEFTTEKTDNDIILYPTIIDGNRVTISGIKNNFKYSVYSAEVLLIDSKDVKSDIQEKTIMFHKQLTSGMYFLRIEQEGGKINTLRFMVK